MGQSFIVSVIIIKLFEHFTFGQFDICARDFYYEEINRAFLLILDADSTNSMNQFF